MVWMGVAPIPVVALVPAPRFGKRMIFAMPFAEIDAIGTVFVVIPIVIVLMVAVVVAGVILRCGRKRDGRWCDKSCAQKQATG